jgi:5-formyltetrahydrofolate cyclo-ligase
MPSKDELRRTIRAILPPPPDIRAENSARLCAAITGSAHWRNARTIAIFAPQPKEPDVEMLWSQAAGRTIAYPRVEDDGLSLYSVGSLFELRPGRWNIREPEADPSRAVAPDAVDLILVPGTAFTRDGRRLGRGGGYYDRLLAGLTSAACKIGVCFDFQIVPELPMEPHDQCVDFVATESGLLGPS